MNRAIFLNTAIFVLLFTIIGDVHVRYCADGKEPAISFHFENIDGHSDYNIDDLEDNDFEKELDLKLVLVKSKIVNHDALVNFNDLFLYLLPQQSNFSPVIETSFNKNESLLLHPPLRAPPQLFS
tara:strand:+ start:391 stop:765 length:375 start_codon:yes stop_codon:yes gene_type:complete